METEKKKRGRPAGNSFPERVIAYETPDGVQLIARLAAHTGMSQAAVLRRAVRELARREGLTWGEESSQEHAVG